MAATDRTNEIDKALVGINRYISPAYSGLSDEEKDQKDQAD